MTRRTRLAEGVFEDRYGLAAIVKVGGLQKEKRFPLGTDLAILRRWRHAMRAELEDTRSQALALVTGTLAHDGDTFITRKKGQAAFKADRSHLRAWYPTFGPVLRSKITRDQIESQLALWRQKNVAVRTIRHRCRVLRECYRSLDGVHAKTPLDHLHLPKLPAPRPVAVPVKTIRGVAASLLKAGLTLDYARFVVRAITGQRPAQVMRAMPADLDFSRKLWFVRSAKGGNPIPFPLNPEAVKAWKYFAKVEAWGVFDTARACDVARAHGWPADIPLYALRSTFAIDLILQGANIGDIQGLLGHAQIQTTRDHYASIQVARLKTVTKTRTLNCQPLPAKLPAKAASRR